MPRKNIFAVGSKLFLSLLFALLCSAFMQGQNNWAVVNTFHVGGEGGWDYMTVDSQNHRLYVPRSTHTMVLDSESGKTIADIPGQKRNHGVAIVPSAGRGFITDGGAGALVVLTSKQTRSSEL